MKKTIVFFNGSRSARIGCMHKGQFYMSGVEIDRDSTYCVAEMDVKGLTVYQMSDKGFIPRKGKVMELEKRSGSMAVVRDEYDNRYTAILCETYYSAHTGLRFLNALVTDTDKMSAKSVAGEGITKKKWIIALNG